MQKDVVISENKLVEDLGTGHSYINLYRYEIEDEESGRTVMAGEQYRVKNPVTRESVVKQITEERFPEEESRSTEAFNSFLKMIEETLINEGL